MSRMAIVAKKLINHLKLNFIELISSEKDIIYLRHQQLIVRLITFKSQIISPLEVIPTRVF